MCHPKVKSTQKLSNSYKTKELSRNYKNNDKYLYFENINQEMQAVYPSKIA